MNKVWRLVLVLALVTVACRAQVNVVLEVNEDGSGTFSSELGIDDEFKQLIELGAEGASVADTIFEGFDLNIPGATTEERVEGDMTFYVAKAPFADIPELTSDFANVNDPNNPFETFSLVVDDKGAQLDAVLALGDLTQSLGDGSDLPFDPSQFTEDIFAFNIVVSLPGTVKESNATETLPDGKLRWAVPLTGGNVEIMARSETGGGGVPGWLLGLILLAVIGAIAAAFVVSRGRRKGVAAIEAAGAAAAVGGADAWSSTGAVADGGAPDLPPSPPTEPSPEAASDDVADGGTGEQPIET